MNFIQLLMDEISDLFKVLRGETESNKGNLSHSVCLSSSLFQVEEFKKDPSPSKCLHSVFNVDTGDEIISYNDYHHLQVGQQVENSRNESKWETKTKNIFGAGCSLHFQGKGAKNVHFQIKSYDE